MYPGVTVRDGNDGQGLLGRNARCSVGAAARRMSAGGVHLRMASPADADSVLAIYAPIVRETVISFETEPPASAEMRTRIESGAALWPWLVCEGAGELLGYAYAGTHRTRAAYRWCVETSVYVAAGARRGGVARALYRALFEILTAQGYCNAYAGITLPNAPSVALHEAVGFVRVGVYARVGYKFGAWHDVGWWARELRAHAPDPPGPLALEAISAVTLRAALARGALMLRY
jgi:L-amino acid N-acyltransferase YncA